MFINIILTQQQCYEMHVAFNNKIFNYKPIIAITKQI